MHHATAVRGALWLLAAVFLWSADAGAQAISDRFGGHSIPGGIKNYGPGKLTPEQLTGCLEADQELQALEAALQRQRHDLDARREELEAMRQALRRDWAEVDHADQTAMAAYRASQERHRSLASEYNSVMLPDYEAKRVRFAQLQERFAADCAGKRYYDDDLQAAKAALGLR